MENLSSGEARGESPCTLAAADLLLVLLHETRFWWPLATLLTGFARGVGSSHGFPFCQAFMVARPIWHFKDFGTSLRYISHERLMSMELTSIGGRPE
jgi:hypothetical protein